MPEKKHMLYISLRKKAIDELPNFPLNMANHTNEGQVLQIEEISYPFFLFYVCLY